MALNSVRLLCFGFLATSLASMTGCAYVETRFQDVSNDPRFAVSYRPGETYRLRTEGRLVAAPGMTRERLELWSPQVVRRDTGHPGDGRLIAVLPVGTTLRVDALEHNYTFAIPPVPGDSEILRAYGTVDSDAGRWTHVRIPDDQDARWSFVSGTNVMAFPPDRAFLERVMSATTVAGP